MQVYKLTDFWRLTLATFFFSFYLSVFHRRRSRWRSVVDPGDVPLGKMVAALSDMKVSELMWCSCSLETCLWEYLQEGVKLALA